MSDQSILRIDTDEELARVMRQLKTLPQQLGAPNVLKNALNSTARKVRRQIIKDSKGRYALKEKKALQSESKILSASASTLEAAVLAKGPMRDIMDFMTQPNTDTAAAAAKVLNSGAMKPLEAGGLKAFITTFRSGHTAIVQRRGAERLPVKKLLSPAVPHMMGNEEVRAEAEALAYEPLQRDIGKRIEQLTGAKARKKAAAKRPPLWVIYCNRFYMGASPGIPPAPPWCGGNTVSAGRGSSDPSGTHGTRQRTTQHRSGTHKRRLENTHGQGPACKCVCRAARAAGNLHKCRCPTWFHSFPRGFRGFQRIRRRGHSCGS